METLTKAERMESAHRAANEACSLYHTVEAVLRAKFGNCKHEHREAYKLLLLELHRQYTDALLKAHEADNS